ncbi:glycosyltransferase family 2 protein [Acetobacter sp. AN02]|uniref:glycosyltransferase family 2 protein n=1 Tax=Acetobacter sp. AN02 TaxID=2894186 RepID=UPI002434655F|nr:glycosyltransferase family 2 protein [Acetobacter sp. AN02]MDG6094734.1 glycosyltransferase family 2 protein [Acetobacter sp. AN02]
MHRSPDTFVSLATPHRTQQRIGIVVPCYNEEEILPDTFRQLLHFLETVVTEGIAGSDSFILCVDDGSRDTTWDLIRQQAATSDHIRGIRLSRNSGHQQALAAGLRTARNCDAVISIDADLQDDLSVVRDMLTAWRSGSQVVCGVRKSRHTDTVFKRRTAAMFYSFMHIMGVDLIPDHADFRLLDHDALQALLEYRERNLFLRGLIPLIGFSVTTIYYDRLPRTAGETKYPLRRMLSLAVEGITSFSITPLRIIALSGLMISGLSLLAIIFAIVRELTGHTVTGWSSIVSAIFFMGGVQMLSLGIIGEYIGKIYLETKMRPGYHIRDSVNPPLQD